MHPAGEAHSLASASSGERVLRGHCSPPWGPPHGGSGASAGDGRCQSFRGEAARSMFDPVPLASRPVALRGPMAHRTVHPVRASSRSVCYASTLSPSCQGSDTAGSCASGDAQVTSPEHLTVEHISTPRASAVLTVKLHCATVENPLVRRGCRVGIPDGGTQDGCVQASVQCVA